VAPGRGASFKEPSWAGYSHIHFFGELVEAFGLPTGLVACFPDYYRLG